MDFQVHFTETEELEPYDFQLTVRGHLARVRKCSPL